MSLTSQALLLSCLAVVAIIALAFVTVRLMQRRAAHIQQAARLVRREERDRLWQEHLDDAKPAKAASEIGDKPAG